MPHTTKTFVLALCALSTPLAAQTPEPPAPERLDPSTGEFTLRPLSVRPGSGLQTQDYSLDGMFQSAHGEFMIKRQRFTPDLLVSYLWQPNQDIGSEPGDFDLSHFEADFRYRLAIDADGFVLVGAGFHHRRFVTSSLLPGTSDENLFGIDLTFGGGYFFNPDTLFEVEVRPALRSDLDGTLHGDDVKIFASGLVTWRLQEDLFLKVGVAHDELYKDANVLPRLGLSWLPVPDWRIDVLLPEYAEVSWMPDASTIFSLGVDVSGDEYHIRGSVANGKPRRDIQVQEIRFGLGITYRFDDRFSLFGRGGLTIAGDYNLADGNSPVTADGTLEPGVFIQAGFGVSF